MEKIYIAASIGYRVTECGQLLNPKNKPIGVIGNTGYLTTNIRINGRVTRIMAHQIQAFQKFGERMFDSGIVVRHLNGVKTDNSVRNIEIGTQSDNRRDIPAADRMRMAVHATSFVKKHDHDSIREYYKTCGSYKLTMRKFGLSSKGTLHFILNS